jgi:outer membrane protein OmpA-like peptidoglycan-associated protein
MQSVIRQYFVVAAVLAAGLATSSRAFVDSEQHLGATNARMSREDYVVIQSMTVHFPNGKAAIAPMYKAQLERFAARAKAETGAVVQVEGFASAVGSDASNQQLIKRRADAVTSVLQQNGVTPTDLVYPASMGTTGQVASNRTPAGQAQNRRAVVKLLQSRGLAGQ